MSRHDYHTSCERVQKLRLQTKPDPLKRMSFHREMSRPMLYSERARASNENEGWVADGPMGHARWCSSPEGLFVSRASVLSLSWAFGRLRIVTTTAEALIRSNFKGENNPELKFKILKNIWECLIVLEIQFGGTSVLAAPCRILLNLVLPVNSSRLFCTFVTDHICVFSSRGTRPIIRLRFARQLHDPWLWKHFRITVFFNLFPCLILFSTFFFYFSFYFSAS